MKRRARTEQGTSRQPLRLLEGSNDEDSARSQLAFLRAINESLGEGVYATDVEGRITFLNPAAQRLLGWQGRDLLGRHAHNAFHHPHPEGQLESLETCPLLAVIRSGVPWSGEEALTRRDGSVFPALVSSAPVRSDGQIVGAVVAFRDDSERRQAELRMRQAEAAAAREAVAAEGARAEAQRLSELEQTKAHFLQVASHELRSPIAVLAGYLQMLADGSLGPVSPAAEQVLPILVHKVGEMNQLVNAMLETVRVEARTSWEGGSSVDLREVAQTVAHAALDKLGGGQHVRVAVPSDPVLVVADHDALLGIVGNLLDNAIKYSPDGGELCLEVTSAGDRARLAVRDPGIGIDAEHLPQLFLRFGRIVTPDNSHIRGAGLGLWLSRELARAQGGTIEVVSVPARGTTFTLDLPLHAAPA